MLKLNLPDGKYHNKVYFPILPHFHFNKVGFTKHAMSEIAKEEKKHNIIVTLPKILDTNLGELFQYTVNKGYLTDFGFRMMLTWQLDIIYIVTTTREDEATALVITSWVNYRGKVASKLNPRRYVQHDGRNISTSHSNF